MRTEICARALEKPFCYPVRNVLINLTPFVTLTLFSRVWDSEPLSLSLLLSGYDGLLGIRIFLSLLQPGVAVSSECRSTEDDSDTISKLFRLVANHSETYWLPSCLKNDDSHWGANSSENQVILQPQWSTHAELTVRLQTMGCNWIHVMF